jgi:hypothetical protein
MTMIPLLKRARPKPKAEEPAMKHTPKAPDLSEYSHPKVSDHKWRADKLWLDSTRTQYHQEPTEPRQVNEPKITESQWRANMVWLNGTMKREQEQNMSKSESAFEKLVTTVRNRDKCSRQDAMHKAREEYPIAFEVYQKKQAVENTPALAKAKPTQKAADDKFEKVINDIRNRDKCSRQDAMHKAREEYPTEFEAFQHG